MPLTEEANVEVLVVGLSRTGTMSMYHALKALDYRCYHMYEACVNAGNGHLIFWNEAIDAKYGHSETGKPSPLAPYDSSDFRKFLREYTALSDAPTVLFVPELLQAFPKAHLVLTTHPRGVDAWLRSIQNSYFRILNWGIWSRVLVPHDPGFSRPYVSLLKSIVEVWTRKPWSTIRDFELVRPQLRKTYEEHNQEVRNLATAQGRPLLEFDPAQGWAPLCEFLGKPVPATGYPHINAGDYVVDIHKVIILKRLKATFQTPVLVVALGLAVLGLGLWWVRRQ